LPNSRFPFQEFTMKVNNGKTYGLIIWAFYKAFDKFPLDKPSFKEQGRRISIRAQKRWSKKDK